MRWFLAAVFAFLLLPSPAHAWGKSGHFTVCEIAYINLTGPAKAEVDRLLALKAPLKSFTEWCIFADQGPQRPTEHFANYPRTTAHVTGPGCPGGTACVITAIEHDLATLRSATASDDNKALALKFVGHWFGDIHQPLHISFADDRGGNQIHSTHSCSPKLHAVWDTCILEGSILPAGTDPLVRARAAAIALNAGVTSAQRHAWQLSQPWQWAAESYEFALQPGTGYCVKKAGACWYSSTQLAYAGGAKRPQLIDGPYVSRAIPIIRLRLQMAGIRLAHELNRTFDPAYHG